jgi:thymidylate synthase (FAD)
MAEHVETKVLDHGYVRLVESWGSDERIIEAARMSTQKGFEGWGVEETCAHCKGVGSEPGFGPGSLCKVCRGARVAINKPGDEKLLAYLWKNNHATPFEMAGAVLEVKAPIFVFREWHRHRTQSYNEMSARYAPLPNENYLPSKERMLMGGGHVTKQAGTVADAERLDDTTAELLRDEELAFNEAAERFYRKKLASGVPRELARTHLPVSRYSRMRASANLRNWLGFLTLRMAPQAQWEIRQFAEGVHGALRVKFPRTLALFDAGRTNAG